MAQLSQVLCGQSSPSKMFCADIAGINTLFGSMQNPTILLLLRNLVLTALLIPLTYRFGQLGLFRRQQAVNQLRQGISVDGGRTRKRPWLFWRLD